MTSLGRVGVRDRISLMADLHVAKADVDADVVAEFLDAKDLEIQHMEMRMLAEPQSPKTKMIYKTTVKNLGPKDLTSES